MLNNPVLKDRAVEFLKGKTFRTMHLKFHNKLVVVGNLSIAGADQTMAYEGFMDRMTVRQHFYGRHKIRLLYPSFPCAVVYKLKGHNAYYPLEVLTLAQEWKHW